jgi:hypothetical protein
MVMGCGLKAAFTEVFSRVTFRMNLDEAYESAKNMSGD